MDHTGERNDCRRNKKSSMAKKEIIVARLTSSQLLLKVVSSKPLDNLKSYRRSKL